MIKPNPLRVLRSSRSVRGFFRPSRTKASLFQLNAAYYEANAKFQADDSGIPVSCALNLSGDGDCEILYSGSPRSAAKKRLGDGSSKFQANKIASEKPITTTNLDRWKRTFSIVRSNVASVPDSDSSSNVPVSDELLRSQAATIYDEDSSDSEEAMIRSNRRGVQTGWGVMYPESLFRVGWEFVGLLFLITQALVTPFVISFPIVTSTVWDILEIIMTCFFMLDMRMCGR